MKYEVDASAYPTLRVTLDPGETLDSEVRAFVALTGQAEVRSNLLQPSRQGVKLRVAGKKSGVTNRFAALGEATVWLTSGIPGAILATSPAPGAGLLVAPHAYIASGDGMELDVTLLKLSKTGRMAFLSFTGTGMVFAGASGAVHELRLADGETMLVDRVHLLAIDASLTLVDGSEKGLWPAVTGQDLAALTGPGRVFLQSLPREPRKSPLAAAVKSLISFV